MWNVVRVVIGVCLAVFAAREMFHDLFHPSERGSVSELIAGRVFSLYRRSPRRLPTAAPLAVVVILLAWAICLATGFAFIYWGVPAENFKVEENVAGPPNGFWTSFYYSLEVMTTLGFGDIKPIPAWLRLIVTLHTLIGFALVTASMTWILLIFPALSRINLLAVTASALREAENRTGSQVVCIESEGVLERLLTGVIQFRVDLIHYPIVYYFRADRDDACLARSIGFIERFATEAAGDDAPEHIRFVGQALNVALDDLARFLAERFEQVDSTPRRAVFQAYADDHLIALGD